MLMVIPERLNRREQAALVDELVKGNHMAFEALILGNMANVQRIVGKFWTEDCGWEWEDLYSEALVEMIRTVQIYSANTHPYLSTLIQARVENRLRKLLMEQTWAAFDEEELTIDILDESIWKLEDLYDRVFVDELLDNDFKMRRRAHLTDRETWVLYRYFGLDGGPEWTLDRIGEELGVNRERVRQIKAKALQKLRGKVGCVTP